jgi:hypothetical protein
MYNEAFARAVLAERAREREAALFLKSAEGYEPTRSRGRVDRRAIAVDREEVGAQAGVEPSGVSQAARAGRQRRRRAKGVQRRQSNQKPAEICHGSDAQWVLLEAAARYPTRVVAADEDDTGVEHLANVPPDL